MQQKCFAYSLNFIFIAEISTEAEGVTTEVNKIPTKTSFSKHELITFYIILFHFRKKIADGILH